LCFIFSNLLLQQFLLLNFKYYVLNAKHIGKYACQKFLEITDKNDFDKGIKKLSTNKLRSQEPSVEKAERVEGSGS
jgi:hypothetical protein